MDVVNAFNELHRQDMLDIAHTQWPEATNILNKLYGVDAPVIYVYKGEDGETKVSVMVSAEGSRMGCVFGSMGFNITVGPRYTILATEFPEFILRALTDDLPAIIPHQETEEKWYGIYVRYAEFLQRWDSLMNPIGLQRHKGK